MSADKEEGASADQSVFFYFFSALSTFTYRPILLQISESEQTAAFEKTCSTDGDCGCANSGLGGINVSLALMRSAGFHLGFIRPKYTAKTESMSTTNIVEMMIAL